MFFDNFFKKKAQGISLETIVIAAIVIIVLIVLVIVFSGRMGWFRTTADSCTGDCARTINECKAGIGYKLESCGTSNPICCPSGLETTK
jgi:hypothetical protein